MIITIVIYYGKLNSDIPLRARDNAKTKQLLCAICNNNTCVYNIFVIFVTLAAENRLFFIANRHTYIRLKRNAGEEDCTIYTIGIVQNNCHIVCIQATGYT